MKTPEEMADEYAAIRSVADESVVLGANPWTKGAFIAGYQAAKDEYQAKMQELEANWKFCCEDKARLLNELAAAERAKDQLADVGKVIPKWNSVDAVRDSIDRSAIRHALAVLKKKPFPQWISVKDRLPEINKGFIGFAENKEVCNCYRYPDHSEDGRPVFYAQTKTGLLICGLESISHWMPLPAPPKED